MNFKKFSASDNQWHDVPYYQHKTATDTLTLPAVIYPNDTSITLGIKGNTIQNGTPTPQNPVDVVGCGERTKNLFDKDNADIADLYPDATTREIKQSSNLSTWSIVLPVEPSTTYTFTMGEATTAIRRRVGMCSDYPTKGAYCTSVDDTPEYDYPNLGNIFTTDADTRYVLIMYVSGAGRNVAIERANRVQVVKGNTALPYEPYGYKIPISVNGQTNNIYLGEVETTRRIKKLVLTGEETNWSATYWSNSFVFYDTIATTFPQPVSDIGICSHFKQRYGNVLSSGEFNVRFTPENNRIVIGFGKSEFANINDFKAYLAQQYATGTPVCVWYVLATPTTATVNEPLMKIGNYADSLTTSIPCTAGSNTLDVQTTVAPSEVSAGFSGWHPITDVHVYSDSSWMPTSWEEFRKAVRSGKAQSLYPVGTKLYENWGDETSDAWIVVDYPTGEDYLDSDLAQQGYTNRVMLMEEGLNYLRQFDAIEAWLYVETAIPAGTYRFTIPNYDTAYGGNKTYIFTSTANVPVGGQITLTWAYQANPSAVQGYSSPTSTTALFNVSIAEWDGGTPCIDLGTIKLAQNDPDSTYGKLNHIHRSRYGSNNYYQSGYRQWLNTNASANWWMPTNVFDRPYVNRTNAGRLNVMNSNMKSVLATPTVNCITNDLFEYPSLDGTTFALQTAYTVKDKLFPVTHTEVNLSSTPNVNSVLDYYVGAQNADRIKYRKDNGNAYYWWLRTPSPTVAYHVRYVVTSGALSTTTAYGTIGSAAACIIQ